MKLFDVATALLPGTSPECTRATWLPVGAEAGIVKVADSRSGGYPAMLEEMRPDVAAVN